MKHVALALGLALCGANPVVAQNAQNLPLVDYRHISADQAGHQAGQPECEFFVGKWANFQAAGNNLSKQYVILAQRHIDDGSDATEFGAYSCDRIVDLGHIGAGSDALAID
jgi:hypothetical protein